MSASFSHFSLAVSMSEESCVSTHLVHEIPVPCSLNETISCIYVFCNVFTAIKDSFSAYYFRLNEYLRLNSNLNHKI